MWDFCFHSKLELNKGLKNINILEKCLTSYTFYMKDFTLFP